MKYPFVIFYRTIEYASIIDSFLLQNASMLEMSAFIANDKENIKQLYNPNFQLLVTFIKEEPEFNFGLRHIHLNNLPTNIHEFNDIINKQFMLVCANRKQLSPIFSLFTTSFNSYHKIQRVYQSLLKQTLQHWEWVIVDDSPDDNHFDYLRNSFLHDPRIRMYRRASNNGNIGNVKNESIALCRGKYLLEMDHDDELTPTVLADATKVFEEYENVGFIYFDCACIYENGENQSFGDFTCKGYGGYYSQFYDGHWRNIYITPNINNITLTHLVCCPNHPRIWRKSVLVNELGNYCEYLPICDDYEIILKTAISTKIAKVHKLGYIQYMNNSNNNFSLIRNSEINRIGPKYISPTYYDLFKIHDQMIFANAYEDPYYADHYSRIWERTNPEYQHAYCNLIINPDYDKQYCLIGIDALFAHLDWIKELYTNTRNDFIVLDNKCSLEYIQFKLEYLGLTRIKCYTLKDIPAKNLVKYFHLLYKSVENVGILEVNSCKPTFNTSLRSRAEVINKVIEGLPDISSYLEIGVEYGETFKAINIPHKIGVDPDMKLSLENTNWMLIHQTSDEFFKTYNPHDDDYYSNLDIVFIDGMHQTEYLVNDLNNAIKCISKNGKIFIDDILPFSYHEQLRIPIKHVYEKNILKYGEPWTGDVWKVVYFLLNKCSDALTHFEYFYNENFRGMACLNFVSKTFAIEEKDIDVINSYNYFTDYPEYSKIIQSFKK
jgi:glycosyltransferase involved in cell wall biosynthesis